MRRTYTLEQRRAIMDRANAGELTLSNGKPPIVGGTAYQFAGVTWAGRPGGGWIEASWETLEGCMDSKRPLRL